MEIFGLAREHDLGSLPASLRQGAPLHGLTGSAQQTSFLPPLLEDEADLFNAGEVGHERIEYDALQPLIRDARTRSAIYFGNWQRDMSQLLAPALHQYLGAGAASVCDLIFEIVDVLSEAKFSRRLDRNRFGTYRWEEHIDNPRDFGVALSPSTCAPVAEALRARNAELEPEAPRWRLNLWNEGPDATPTYLHISRRYVLRQLNLALVSGRTARGLEHLGNALHTVEDFYAHSNFIELGYNLLGGDDPRTGLNPSAPPPRWLRDSRGRYRLTTGVFLLNDTVESLSKLFLMFMETPPGTRPSPVQRRVTRVLIRRLLGTRVLGLYDQLIHAWDSTGIPARIGRVQQALERAVLFPLRLAISAVLRPLAEAGARQTGQRTFPMPPGSRVSFVQEISHSLLAKDDTAHRHHGVARQLAIRAVREFWCQIDAAWSRRSAPEFPRLVSLYMQHPQAVGRWWEPVLRGSPLPAPRCTPSRVRPPSPTTSPTVLTGFAFRSSALQPRHLAEIERIAARLASRSPGIIRVVGHTDSTGPAAYNVRLGEARAQSVRQALASALERRGARAPRFVVESRGEEQPVADNRTSQNRARNRRVEILFNLSSP
ncbi:MAG: OmpA family protein [Thermoanaerobaculia bacterium]